MIMYILGIESSCDETSASVIFTDTDTNENKILSNIIASSVNEHALYGGVVPEIASRAHIEAISNVTYAALDEAKVKLSDIGCIAVTSRPGLIGSLLVGVNFAKSLAYANNIPLVSVHHIKGHIAANYLLEDAPKPPFFAFVVSGGHTSLIDVKDYDDMITVGTTRDDAIGEAFDKAGRVLGLSYPCGAEMDKLAYEGDCNAVKFPLAAIKDDTLDFSFSGLKTAVINYVNRATMKGEEINRADVAASFTKTVCDSVIKKTELAYERYRFKKLVISGGVAANSHLRRVLSQFCEKHSISFYCPPISLCGDNGAMIAAQGKYEYLSGNFEGTSLNGKASEQVCPKACQ